MIILRFDTKNLIEICRQNDVSKIGVFGSMARREAGELSDIDLLVEFSRRRAFWRSSALSA